MTRIPTRLTAVAAVCLLLSACQSSRVDSAKDEYVAMGDSYAAAPGIGTVDPPLACRKSKNNYPHQLAELADLDLTDVSCSGAPTDGVMGEQDALGQKMAPQIEAVDEDTDVVTIGLGFNDLGLSVRVFVGCVQVTAADPAAKTPCTDADRNAGANGTQSILDQVTDRLDVVVEEVRERAPEADIYLVGYPTIFPTDETCDNLGMAVGDLPLMRHIVDSLNTSLEKAAEAHDATYVDLATPTRDHHVCADDPWIAGISAVGGKQALAWHPYVDEQTFAAETLAKLIESSD